MKKAVILAFLSLALVLFGISCSSQPSNTSWDSPEDYVSYDVANFVNLSLDNDNDKIKTEYHENLLDLATTIYNRYSVLGEKPDMVKIDRYSDGCWAILTNTFVGSKYDNSRLYDEATFYYLYNHEKWELMYVKLEGYVNGTKATSRQFTIPRE